MDDIKSIIDHEFDPAIIGTRHESLIPVYSLVKIIKILVKNHQMDYFEAKEHFEMNMKHIFDQHDHESVLVDDLHFII